MIDELFQKMFLDRFFPSSSFQEKEKQIEESEELKYQKKLHKEKIQFWKQQLKKINNQFC